MPDTIKLRNIRKLKALHEKTPGVRNPCSFRTAYTDAGGFAFEVNGEHGSVQGWGHYSTHASDTGVVTTTLWGRQLAQQSGSAQLLSIVDSQLRPPSHRRRGATTVFGQNRHHRECILLFLHSFPDVFFFAVLLRNQGRITAEPRRCHCGHGDPTELPLRFDGGATAIIGGSTAGPVRCHCGAGGATAVLLGWRCGSRAAPWRPRGG